jgi:hypothetical protein
MQSKATTPEEYLAALPEDRRIALTAVRETILANLDPGFVESIQWGHICYHVPLELKKGPLAHLAIASQANYMALYLVSACGDDRGNEWFRKETEAITGKKLDMGKGCVRFKRLNQLPLEMVAKAAARLTMEERLAQG